MSRPEGEERTSVYVWDIVIRLTHWLIVLSIGVLAVTGIYIGAPFLISSGPANQAFVMGYIRITHFYGSMVFTCAVGLRIVWMFIGPKYARWNQLVPTTVKRIKDMIGTLMFYSFIKAEPPPAVGHNAMAGASYLAVFGLYLTMIVTGLALYGGSAHVDSYMRVFAGLLNITGGAQTARWIHHVVMWLILGFAVQHIYSAWLMSRVERNGGMDSIFSGWKTVPKGQRHD